MEAVGEVESWPHHSSPRQEMETTQLHAAALFTPGSRLPGVHCTIHASTRLIVNRRFCQECRDICRWSQVPTVRLPSLSTQAACTWKFCSSHGNNSAPYKFCSSHGNNSAPYKFCSSHENNSAPYKFCEGHGGHAVDPPELIRRTLKVSSS
jgi:hypothetical protein